MLSFLAAALIAATPPATPAPAAPPAAPLPAARRSLGARPAAPAPVARTDTLVQVAPGVHLELNNFEGMIDVRAWQRNAVRVAALHSERALVHLVEMDSVLKVAARALANRARGGPPPPVDYQIEVPSWMPLDLWGVQVEISVDGVKSPVKASSVKGPVRLRGGRGPIFLNSVEGEVEVLESTGRLQLSSVNAGIKVADCEGEIVAESVNGPIVLARVHAPSIEATTVNGEVSYEGDIPDGSDYRFVTHNGSIVVGLAPRAGGTVSVSTFNGEFESDFPITLTGARLGRRMVFQLGPGSGRLNLESFQGNIQLHRRVAPRPKE
jgi:hypothetical protein